MPERRDGTTHLIDLERMKRDFNNADGWFVTVGDQAHVLTLIEAVEAAEELIRSEDVRLGDLPQIRLSNILQRFVFGGRRA